MIPYADSTQGTSRSWTNTSGGATTSATNELTDDVYGDGDGDCYATSIVPDCYCDKEEEEEVFIEEESFELPSDEHLPTIRDYFGIIREPP